MLDITPSDRPILVRVFSSCFSSSDEVVSFLTGSPVSDAVRDRIRTITKEEAVASLVDALIRNNELQLVLPLLAVRSPHRADIRQLLATMQRRPGWGEIQAELPPADFEFDLGGGEARTESLEKLTTERDPFVDISDLIRCLEESRKRVCFLRRRKDKQDLGSAFLVGPNLLLTCFHVIEQDCKISSGGMTLRVEGLEAVFDYFVADCGTVDSSTSLPGREIDAEFDCPFAPYAAPEKKRESNGRLPTTQELDFALLRIVGEPLLDRGYFDLTRDVKAKVEIGSPVVIALHPGDLSQLPARLRPMKVSFAQPGVAGYNDNRTRLKYYNGTLKGASGSPVFDRTGQLIALHHNRGESLPGDSQRVRNNHGVPLHLIVPRLTEHLTSPTPDLTTQTTVSLPAPIANAEPLGKEDRGEEGEGEGRRGGAGEGLPSKKLRKQSLLFWRVAVLVGMIIVPAMLATWDWLQTPPCPEWRSVEALPLGNGQVMLRLQFDRRGQTNPRCPLIVEVSSTPNFDDPWRIGENKVSDTLLGHVDVKVDDPPEAHAWVRLVYKSPWGIFSKPGVAREIDWRDAKEVP